MFDTNLKKSYFYLIVYKSVDLCITFIHRVAARFNWLIYNLNMIKLNNLGVKIG